MSKCAVGKTWTGSVTRCRCQQPAERGSLYCQAHLSQALARVETVRDERPKPWPGLIWDAAREWGY